VVGFDGPVSDAAFDPRGRHVWIHAGRRLLRSEDGLIYRAVLARGFPGSQSEEVEPLSGGVVGGRGRTLLYIWLRDSGAHLVVSHDAGRTFRVIKPRLPVDVFSGLFDVDAAAGRLSL